VPPFKICPQTVVVGHSTSRITVCGNVGKSVSGSHASDLRVACAVATLWTECASYLLVPAHRSRESSLPMPAPKGMI
jgi:hypothetical protein